MTRYVPCDVCHVELPDDLAHMPHEPGCDQLGCTCDTYVCPLCCDECNQPVPVIEGQVEAFPEASTKPLSKRRSA